MSPGTFSQNIEWTTSEEGLPICPGWHIHALTYAYSPMHIHIPTHIKLNHKHTYTYIQKIMPKSVTHISGSFVVYLFVSTSRFILSGFLSPEIALLKTCHLKLPAHQDWCKSSVGKTWAWLPGLTQQRGTNSYRLSSDLHTHVVAQALPHTNIHKINK